MSGSSLAGVDGDKGKSRIEIRVGREEYALLRAAARDAGLAIAAFVRHAALNAARGTKEPK